MTAASPENVPSEPTEAATPAPSDQQAGVPNWATLRESLPAELRDAPYIQNHNGLEDLVRDAITQNRLVGFEKIARPTEESPEEDWGLFFDAMGRPQSPAEYDLGDFAPPEEVDWDDGLQKGMLEDFHRAGLSQKQVRDVMGSYADRQKSGARDRTETLQQERTETERSLRDAWGNAYERRKQVAGDEFQRVFGDKATEVMNIALPNGRLFGNEPSVIEAFFKLGDKHLEHGLVGERSVAEPSLAPAEALAKAQEMESDPAMLAAITEGKASNPHFKRWSMLMDFAHPEEPR